MWIFCELRSIFSELRRGEEKCEQWAKCPLLLIYAKPSNKKFIIPPQKKHCYFAIGFYFLVRVFRNILILSVRITLTMSKMFARIICQTIEWEVDYLTAKEKCYLGFCFLVRVSKTSGSFSNSCSFCIRRYSPYCKPVKPGHYSVLRSRIMHVLLTLYGKMT